MVGSGGHRILRERAHLGLDEAGQLDVDGRRGLEDGRRHRGGDRRRFGLRFRFGHGFRFGRHRRGLDGFGFRFGDRLWLRLGSGGRRGRGQLAAAFGHQAGEGGRADVFQVDHQPARPLAFRRQGEHPPHARRPAQRDDDARAHPRLWR